jgi:hypothetical protein
MISPSGLEVLTEQSILFVYLCFQFLLTLHRVLSLFFLLHLRRFFQPVNEING